MDHSIFAQIRHINNIGESGGLADLRGADLNCVDLSGADLRGVDLHYADLRGADLRGADLRGADLRGADLNCADLRCADLRDADLRDADLRDADLRDADLSGATCGNAVLSRADLRGADLSGADLRGADLCGADLSGANLRHTCLDPSNPLPKTDLSRLYIYPSDSDFVVGWRTVNSPYIDKNHVYLRGREYSAPWFSTDEKTECHPGLYFGSCAHALMILALRSEVLGYADKYRARRFYTCTIEEQYEIEKQLK